MGWNDVMDLVCHWHGWSQYPSDVIEGTCLTLYSPYLGSARLLSKLAELFYVPLAMSKSSNFSISFFTSTILGRIISDRKAANSFLYIFGVLNSHVLLGPGLNKN